MNSDTKELFKFDKVFFQNFGLVAGVDEAGRGPLAGPVVCACVVMPLEDDKMIDGINDSKKVSSQKREKLFDEIKNVAIAYSIVEIDEKTIDRINILNATKLGMKRAILDVENTLRKNFEKDIRDVLIDAVKLEDLDLKQENIIKGDAKSYNIASASILAKVYRDKLMQEFSKKYSEYHFEKHKGYGTKDHIESLKKFGKCEIHRDSFIKKFIKTNNQ